MSAMVKRKLSGYFFSSQLKLFSTPSRERLSKIITDLPSESNLFARLVPTKPAPPVIKIYLSSCDETSKALFKYFFFNIEIGFIVKRLILLRPIHFLLVQLYLLRF